MNSMTFNPATARYVSLSTYRRNGSQVATPVWLAQAGPYFYLFSAGDAGKVKRVRASPMAKIAPCDIRGNVQGPWVDVKARIVEEPEVIERAYAALRAKYGWQMALLDFVSGLSGKKWRRVVVELVASVDAAIDLPQ